MNITNYLVDQSEAILKIDHDAVRRQVEILRDLRENGGTVYTCGNGGSHALASHAVCDFMSIGLRAACLGDNIPMLTATANDEDYNEVFRWNFDTERPSNAVLLLISASGNSANLVRVAGLGTTLAWLGMGGGSVVQFAHDSIVIDSDDYGVIEAAHDVLLHLITAMLRE